LLEEQKLVRARRENEEPGMKVVLFCGGEGMRMRGYSEDVPKPMVTIGERPVLWHVMKYYAHYGHKDFVLALGYKANAIKEYFLNYKESVSNDFTLSRGGRQLDFMQRDIDDWKITFVDTGLRSNIGMRLKAVEPLLRDEEMFLANYSDGVTDAFLPKIIQDFQASGATAQTMAVQPTATSLDTIVADDEGFVRHVKTMTEADIWINGGFMCLKPEIFNYIKPGEELIREPFARLIQEGKLRIHRHHGFWQCMDTFKDKQVLDELDARGGAPWQVWKQPVLNVVKSA
jgi:glucose-1-phosphate cytidylyltransferase